MTNPRPRLFSAAEDHLLEVSVIEREAEALLTEREQRFIYQAEIEDQQRQYGYDEENERG